MWLVLMCCAEEMAMFTEDAACNVMWVKCLEAVNADA